LAEATATLPAGASDPPPVRLPIGTGEFVVMIAALMALNALAIDVMLPALDDIAGEMGVSGNDQQLVIYAYILGFGVPQLAYGPLSDRYGRRPVLFAALAGYTITGLLCSLATGFGMLLAMRFAQGVFASGCRVVAVGIVRDVFMGRGMARIMSLVMTIFMVVPILAPSIGQLILFVAPWEWTFGILALAGGLVFLWTYTRLAETRPPARRTPLNLYSIIADYSEVVRTPVTFGYVAASGVIFGALFAFIGTAEQVYTEVFDTGESFVLWFAGVALMLSAANFTNSRLVERFGMRRISHGALIGFCALSFLLVVLLSVFGEQFRIFYPVFTLIFACFGLIGSNFNALAMEPLGRIAGTASAAQGFATTTVSSLIGWAIGTRYDGSVIPVMTGFAVLGLVSLAIVLITERGRLFSAR
jgi:DHA1 family bicyclomycin/chloramphenicol resistance-like MFS transporter